jgi:hypothetical protein
MHYHTGHNIIGAACLASTSFATLVPLSPVTVPGISRNDIDLNCA